MKRSKACGLARATGTPTYTYVYDRFGNRWQQNSPAGSIYTSSFTFTGNSGSNTNRLDGYSYDSAGNLLYDNVHHYFYDAENRLMQVDGTLPYCTSNGASGNAATSCYYYDAEGHRVHRTGIDENPCNNDGNGGSGDFAFDLDGNWTVRTNSTGGACASEIYLGGRHFGTSAGNINFDHTDWLGTSRLRNSTSTITSGYEACTSLPFGDGLLCNSTYGSNIHFTGKEHDYETGLDDFGARYDASSIGRFMSTDPMGGHRIDPQTLNKYAYVRNNPLNLTDPTGMDFNLSCSKNNGTTCQNGSVYYKDQNGDYKQTLIHSDDKGNLSDQSGNKYTANVTGAGVSFTGNGGTNTPGTFVNGTNATTINGNGALSGFTFNFTYSNSAGNVTAGGTFRYDGNYVQAEHALERAGFQHYAWDENDIFHPSTFSHFTYDYRSPGEVGTGAGSGHFSVFEPWANFPWDGSLGHGDVHLGEHNNNTPGGLLPHIGEVVRTLINKVVPIF